MKQSISNPNFFNQLREFGQFSLKNCKIKKIYLAHPSSERDYGDKLQSMLENLGFEVINPFTSFGLASGEDDIDIVEQDLAGVSGCDVVVAFIPHEDMGIMGEILYATVVALVPVISLTSMEHIWINFCSSKVCRLEEELMKFMEELRNERKSVTPA